MAKTGITFLCPSCGQLVEDTAGTEEIDSGTTLLCSATDCGVTVIVDIYLPEEREHLHKARERMHLLPTYAMAICAAPEKARNAVIVERARAKVQEWLAEMS